MNGVPVARLFGFEIRIHFSWVLIVALIAVFVADRIGQIEPASSAALRWVVGGAIAFAFLLSVLAHELAHAIVARRRGVQVGPITVYFFGGSASFQLEADKPRDEAAIAVAGPAVSLGIGALLIAVAAVASSSPEPMAQVVAAVAVVLAALNLLLGGVNLLPAYPLDAGRLVRALVWARTGDERRGAKAAATTGRFAGWVLVGAGLVLIVLGRQSDGLMLGISGWALSSASRGITRRLAVQELLQDVRVGDVMERDVATVPPNLTIDTFADRLMEGAGGAAVPVLRDEELLGLIGSRQLKRLGRRAWATTRAEDVMVVPPALPLVGPDETLWSALDRLRRTNLDGLPVVEGVRFLGVVTRGAIVATIQSRARTQGITLR
jgi:Zn-dependent protease/predicted transcriptional regulator